MQASFDLRVRELKSDPRCAIITTVCKCRAEGPVRMVHVQPMERKP
jgi:hypothetical protein